MAGPNLWGQNSDGQQSLWALSSRCFRRANSSSGTPERQSFITDIAISFALAAPLWGPGSKSRPSKTAPAKAGRRGSSSSAITTDGCGSVPHPAGVSPGAFGLVVTGDCLAPKVRDWKVLLFEKGLPKPGELAVIWAQGLDMPQLKILVQDKGLP
jgi:hypothetical protein